MQEFKIGPKGIKEIEKAGLQRSLPITFLLAAAGVFISIYVNGPEMATGPFTFITIAFVALIAAFGFINGRRKQRKMLESYRLIFLEKEVVRKQVNTITISIKYSEVKEILQSEQGHFVIAGKKLGDTIGIPSKIEKYDEVRNCLENLMPITTNHKVDLLRKYILFLPLLLVGLVLSVFVGTNKILVGCSGVVLVCVMVWSLVKTQQSKNIDKKTKSASWMILIVLVSVIMVVIAKLIGFQHLLHK